MTNQERIDLRERALRLARDFGAIIGTTYFDTLSENLFSFLSKDIERDPIMADVPSPSREIDWSRPQFVVSKHDPTLVVRTTGEHIGGLFTGFGPDDGDSPQYSYKKKYFVYHGEIPESPSNDNKWTDAEFLEWVYERMKHVHGENEDVDYMTRLRSVVEKMKARTVIGQEISEKSTGLNFLEAIRLLKSGKGIERPRVEGRFLSQYGMKGKKICYLDSRLFATLNMEDFLATDWQIVKS